MTFLVRTRSLCLLFVVRQNLVHEWKSRTVAYISSPCRVSRAPVALSCTSVAHRVALPWVSNDWNAVHEVRVQLVRIAFAHRPLPTSLLVHRRNHVRTTCSVVRHLLLRRGIRFRLFKLLWTRAGPVYRSRTLLFCWLGRRPAEKNEQSLLLLYGSFWFLPFSGQFWRWKQSWMFVGWCLLDITGTLSSNSQQSVLAVRHLESTFVAYCLFPAQCTIWDRHSDKRKRHRASFPKTSDIANNHLRASWSVQTVYRFPCRYSSSNSTS